MKSKIMTSIVLGWLTVINISFASQKYDLEEFDDLKLKSQKKDVNNSNSNPNKGQRLILFDDNLYLLDDDFDFGEDEFELQKLELDPEDMETAEEYEDFLNAFFENSVPIGKNSYNSPENSRQKKKNKQEKKRPSRKIKNKPDRSSSKTYPQSEPFKASRGAMGFGISTIVGATIPVTMNGFSTGSNMGIRINTPVSFNIAGMEANIGTDVYFSSMTANIGNDNLKLTNIVGNISIFPLQSINSLRSVEIRSGIGFTPTSIGDYSDSGLSFPIDINYYFPMSFSGFSFALNFHAQRTFAYPTSGNDIGDTTDLIYLGILINTPLQF